MKFLKEHKKTFVFIICLLLAFIFMLLGSKSSPLYPINDWGDSNSFFTLGKGMFNGKTLYSDLFEQKGPLLYFIHALASLISSKTFLGVYIMESLFFSVYLYFSYKLLNLFIKKEYAIIFLPIISFLTIYSYNFSHGDSAEEMCLPFLMISLYYLVKFLKEKTMNNKIIFINGLMAGIVLTIKYTMLGFWFAWMMMVFIITITNKEYKIAFKYCGIFLLGMAIPLIPWIIYFIINNSLKEFIDTYFIFNMTSYSKTITIIDRIKCIGINLIVNIKRNVIASILTILGLVYTVIANKKILKKITIPIVYIFLLIGIYAGGVAYRYYYLITLPFMIFGLIYIGIFINNIKCKYYLLFSLLLTILLSFIMYNYGHNSYFMHVKYKDLAQYQFAKIIKQEENPTILNYGFLDGGFYLACDIIPDFKYFQQNNIDYKKYPIIKDSQNKYVEDKTPKFIITRTKQNKKNKKTFKGYTLIKDQDQFFQGDMYTYHLYKKD